MRPLVLTWVGIGLVALVSRAVAAPPDPCTGPVVDLAKVRGLCRVAPGQQRDALEELSATLKLPPRVVSGQAFTFELVLENRGKHPLELRFVEDESRFDLRDRSGKPLPVAGGAFASPRDCSRQGDPYVPFWRVSLPPGGKATELLGGRANGLRWPPFVGCDGGRPEPDELAPLAAGSYQVVVTVSLSQHPLTVIGELVVTAAPAPGAPGDPCTAVEHNVEGRELPECRVAAGTKVPTTGLSFKLIPASATVARGGKIDLVFQIVNTSGAPASMMVHREALTISARDARGRVLGVAGKPAPPAPSCLEGTPAGWVAPLYRLTLPPAGIAHGERSWIASHLAYGKQPQACNPSVPQPGEPLPAGRYTLKATLDGVGSAETTIVVVP